MQELGSPGESGCGCGCGESSVGSGGDLGAGPIPGINQKVIVRHRPGTVIGNVINPFQENGAQIYELDDLILVKPVVTFYNDAPAVSQIGETIAAVIYNGSIVPGTYPIVSRLLTPDPGIPVDLTAPFFFQKLNVKRTTPGTAELFTVQAEDDQGNVSSASAGVVFKHAVYRGYNTAAVLTQVQIKSLTKTLNDSIVQAYGGSKTYVVPAGPPKYIYWCGPIGTQAIAAAALSGFGLPLTDLAPVNVTNEFDGSIVNTYWVKRTSNLFSPGTYDISIS
jgi:hypothetical protein